jgi:hypothetical protein
MLGYTPFRRARPHDYTYDARVMRVCQLLISSQAERGGLTRGFIDDLPHSVEIKHLMRVCPEQRLQECIRVFIIQFTRRDSQIEILMPFTFVECCNYRLLQQGFRTYAEVEGHLDFKNVSRSHVILQP